MKKVLGRILILFASLLVFAPIVARAMPSWVSSTKSEVTDSIVEVNCSGDGPSADLARSAAINDCLGSAGDLIAPSLNVSTLVVETETSAGLHQEIAKKHSFKGLTCQPIKEVVEGGQGSFTVWVRCRFDRSKVAIVEISNVAKKKENAKPLSLMKVSKERKRINISTVPSCTTLIVKGKSGRIIKCDRNPMEIVVDQGEKTVLIRADGHQPEEIEIGGDKHEQYEIILNPL